MALICRFKDYCNAGGCYAIQDLVYLRLIQTVYTRRQLKTMTGVTWVATELVKCSR